THVRRIEPQDVHGARRLHLEIRLAQPAHRRARAARVAEPESSAVLEDDPLANRSVVLANETEKARPCRLGFRPREECTLRRWRWWRRVPVMAIRADREHGSQGDH